MSSLTLDLENDIQRGKYLSGKDPSRCSVLCKYLVWAYDEGALPLGWCILLQSSLSIKYSLSNDA